MLIRDTNHVYRSTVKKAVGDKATADDVLDYIFGDGIWDDKRANFVIREWRTNSRKPIHRINMFWAIPLTILCIPYQYIVKGQCGWDTKTAFSRWILRVTGHLADE